MHNTLLSPLPTLEEYFDSTMEHAGGFEDHPTLAVAVSGGADSIALMLLAHDWAQNHGGKVVTLTVDHHLRAEAKVEAQLVGKVAKKYSIEHHILNIKIENTNAAIQEQARDLRYQAMENFCKQHHILHLLTAHHFNDNVETLAMRAQRGSNATIPFIRYTNNLRLLRPLLDIHKRELVDYLTSNNIKWIEDSSNQSDDYERNRVRKNLGANPVDEAKTKQLIHQAAQEKKETQKQCDLLALESLRSFKGGYLELDISTWSQYDNNIIIYMLINTVHSLGATDKSPRYHQLEQLIAELLAGETKGCCLGGLQFTRMSEAGWLITREISHIAAPSTLISNQKHWWDGRFTVECGQLPNDNYIVAALGEQGIAQIKATSPQLIEGVSLPKLLALPAIWRLDQLCFVPHIYYATEGNLKDLITLTPRWRQPLLGSAHRYLM